jgi:hypothetical protein
MFRAGTLFSWHPTCTDRLQQEPSKPEAGSSSVDVHGNWLVLSTQVFLHR